MDTATCLFGDISMARKMSKNSAIVAESKASPHYQRMMGIIKQVAADNNQLTDEEIDQLERDRNNMYRRQVINRIRTEDDFENANRETVELTAIMSKHHERFIDGALSFTTSFTEPVINVLKDAAYGGTTGMKRKEDGTRDHTARRVHVATTNERFKDMANLSADDKMRVIRATEVANDCDKDDPFEAWSEHQMKLEQARKARLRDRTTTTAQHTTSSSSDGSGVDWSSLL